MHSAINTIKGMLRFFKKNAPLITGEHYMLIKGWVDFIMALKPSQLHG